METAPIHVESVVLPSGRRQTPSTRQLLALQNLSENGGNKGKALLDAGYSKSVAKTPSRVFGLPTVAAFLDADGLTKELAIGLRDLLNMYKSERMTFPPDDPSVEQWKKVVGTGEDAYTISNRTTDDDIHEMFAETGCRVVSIVHRKNDRLVQFFSRDGRALAQALDMGFKIRGAYAPTRVYQAPDDGQPHSLKDIRERRVVDSARLGLDSLPADAT